MYAISLRRVEYLIIWGDNNFHKSNPKNYNISVFNNMNYVNEEMKNYAYRKIKTKKYYVYST